MIAQRATSADPSKAFTQQAKKAELSMHQGRRRSEQRLQGRRVESVACVEGVGGGSVHQRRRSEQ